MHNSSSNQKCLSILLSIFLLSAITSSKASPKLEPKSLYERLGGVYAIAMVVDSFIDVLAVNDVLNANPDIDKARKRLPVAGLKFHVTAMVCQHTGGPCQYTGRAMKESHAHLNISEAEWQSMGKDFVRILNNYQVPKQEQSELLAIIESVKADIVMN